VCGACGQLFANIGKDYLACRAARQGTCHNTTRIRRGRLEAQVLDGLARRLMHPDLVQEFISAFIGEWNRLVRESSVHAEGQQRELRAVERKIANVIDAITDGVRGDAVHRRLEELEDRRAELQRALLSPPVELPALHPNLAEVYRSKVANLQQALAESEEPGALEAARALIDRVIVSPPPSDGEPVGVELVGELAESLRIAILGDSPRGRSTPVANVLSMFASSVKNASGGKAP
jgi:site-specific DNA recombinase